jgi:hypothetical protein
MPANELGTFSTCFCAGVPDETSKTKTYSPLSAGMADPSLPASAR